MKQKEWQGISLLATRVVVAAIFLWHGFPKAIDWGLAMTKFSAMGFPGFLGPIVGIVEVVLGITLLIGFWTRCSSYVLGLVILVATLFVQMPKGVTAGLERDLLILVALGVLAAYGPGTCAVQKKP